MGYRSWFFLNLVLTGWAISQFVTEYLYAMGWEQSLTWVLPFLIAPFLVLLSLATLRLDAVSCGLYSNNLCIRGYACNCYSMRFLDDLMMKSFALNLVYLVVGLYLFLSFQAARRHGLFYNQVSRLGYSKLIFNKHSMLDSFILYGTE